MKKKAPYFALFAIIFLLSYRFFLFKFSSIGHNWDWTFPALDFLAGRMPILSQYTWYNFDLGGQLDLTISHLIPNYLFSWISSVVHVKGAIFILFLLIESIAFLSFKKLIDYLIGKEMNINYISALLFSFSPFLFNEIIGGSWYMWISYAFAPLFFLSLARYIEGRQVKYLAVFLFSSIFVIASLQNFVLVEVIFVFYFSLLIFVKKYHLDNIKSVVFGYISAHLALLLLNGYWIAPFLSLQDIFQKTVLSHGFVGDFSSVRHTKQSIINIFSLVGYLDRNLYYYIISVVPVFLAAVFSVLMFVVWAIFFRQNGAVKKNGIVWFLIIIFLVLIIKGGQPPFSLFTIKFFEMFPLMNLYRSPQHLMFGAAFIVPILVAFSLNFICEINKFKKLTVLFFTVAIICWISGWWITGDLGSGGLKSQKRDAIDFYGLPPELIKIYNYNEISKLDHRIVFLPTVFSPYYLKNRYQLDGQGGQPEYMYLKNATIRAETNIFAKNVEESFCFESELSLINYLSLINVKYISDRSDILPKFSKCGESSLWNSKNVAERLNNNSDLKLIFGGKYSLLHGINNDKYLPHLYVPGRSVISKRTTENLSRIVSSSDWNIRSSIFFEEQNVNKIDELSSLKVESYKDVDESKLPTLEFKKINPTKYRVRVHGASGVFPVVFSESFHNGWKAYLAKSETPTSPQSSPQAGEAEVLKKYKIMDGNSEDQATKEELNDFVQKGLVTDLGDGKERTIEHKKWNSEKQKEELDYVEKYSVDFVSKNFQGTIQNDNLPKGSIFETWFKKPIDDQDHLMVNGYANSWIINPREVCKVESSSSPSSFCVQNPDGSYDFEMVVEFWPQRLFYVGVFISGTTLLGCVFYLGFDYYRRKKSKRQATAI